jgi:hypothetical protein
MVLWMRIVTLALALTFFGSLLACASESAQQNFKDWLQQQLGKSVDDPDAYINRYPENRITTRNLPNGNLELKYKGGHLLRCTVYFEIDKSSRTIISEHYEGTGQNCSINR